MTDEQEQPREPTTPTHDALLTLYEIGTRNIEFAKLQQWRLLYYISLLYAAFIYLDTKELLKNFECNLYWLTGLGGIAAVAVLATLQKWMRDERRRMEDVKKKLNLDQLDENKSQTARTISNSFIFVLMIAIIVVGAWITLVVIAT